ncbi:D-2-hydroxyacid dehydrogenase [Maridesulfovibrio salexigens]|uniref:D-isomer specific 2-hydroxyacid dehydrogenase NAD-binding n=1 Tax=Maridesulfovibrio salexigens (strain ATCC 14822 / DSM 2638 / NCIMB 8403 / VKM B-1763) TaxID=526222 RepID=C6BYS5_MARSD|nr:D-2-hydroxyacid dehydrogenase [Maridesulfovibrio salexigens]ACS80682.1 D-isomer specific 2-hydroxyacid dehydrogenase NAD-binding [Maridesulfovibrio salexigens DSM 2638]
MKTVILDSYTLNPGDNPWTGLDELCELAVYDRTKPEQILERAAEADIILTNKTVLDADTIKALPKLKFISVLATGYNVVDLDAAAARNIPVSNVPGYSPPSVAQHVFAMILNHANRVALHDQAVKEGQWAQQEDFCFWNAPLIELAGKKMGIVGFGAIGQKVGTIANSFGMEVLAYAPRPKPEPQYSPFKFVSLKKLFREADVVSLHCPLTAENEKFINKELLSSMKANAYLINTARGPLVDESDLAEALTEGVIAGAALDVVEKEPMLPGNPLSGTPNLTITPHIAWATLEARTRLTEITVTNVKAFLQGKAVNVVNGI